MSPTVLSPALSGILSLLLFDMSNHSWINELSPILRNVAAGILLRSVCPHSMQPRRHADHLRGVLQHFTGLLAILSLGRLSSTGIRESKGLDLLILSTIH
jgi:hypothetical protein